MALLIDDLGLRPFDLVGPGRKARVFEFTADTEYAAGGYALAEAALGFTTVELVLAGPSAGFVPQYDYTAEKMMFLYGNYDAADGPLIEVADGLDALADVTFRVLVIGTVA